MTVQDVIDHAEAMSRAFKHEEIAARREGDMYRAERCRYSAATLDELVRAVIERAISERVSA